VGKKWAAKGFVYLVQDVRGRGDSDGEFYPLVTEAPDGYDTIEWAAKQPWSNGKIGTTGWFLPGLDPGAGRDAQAAIARGDGPAGHADRS
jgi:hypothetical protein